MSKPPVDRGELIFSPERGPVSAPKASAKQRHGEQGPESRSDSSQTPDDGIVRISRERRRGKGVSVISGLPISASELKALGKALKQRCGCGGTIRQGTIEIQGDHRDLLLSELSARGYKVKRVGG